MLVLRNSCTDMYLFHLQKLIVRVKPKTINQECPYKRNH